MKDDTLTTGIIPINLMLPEFMEVLMASISSGVIFFRKDRTILMANREAVNMEVLGINYNAALIYPRYDFSFFNIENNIPEPVSCPVSKVINGNSYHKTRMLIVNHKNGLSFHGNLTGKPIFSITGKFLAGMLIIEKLSNTAESSEIRELQTNEKNTSLLIAKPQLNALMDIIHELRTPLNSILGFSELLKKTVTDVQQASYLNALSYNAKRMAKLVNNYLDMNNFGNAINYYEYHRIAITDILKQIQMQFLGLIEKFNKKHIELIFAPPGDELVFLFTNIDRFLDILNNLISNAIKYTNKGYIEFGWSYKKNENHWVFYVKDTGIGIKKSNFDTLFSPFKRVENQMTKKNEGTGLGLSITKINIESLGGTIWCESEPGKGSAFYFTHPSFEPGSEVNATGEKNLTITYTNKKLLIVEDDSFSLMLLKEMLKDSEIEIKAADTGKNALEIFQKKMFDLVFLDIHLPDMNGYQILEQMRAFNPSIAVVALTADMIPNFNNEPSTVEFDYFATKPISSPDLFKILNIFLNRDINTKIKKLPLKYNT